MKITKTSGVKTITQSYPDSMDVFSRYGVTIDGENDEVDQTLEQLCLKHALDYEEVVTELYKTVE